MQRLSIILGIVLSKGLAPQRVFQMRWFGTDVRLSKARADSMCNLGRLYATGTGIPKDYSQALVFLTRAAQLGDAESQFLLGMMYYEGKGVTRDVDEAIHWLIEAAQRGSELAKNNLGVMPEFLNSLQVVK
jgi:hypothetical protein